MTERSAWTRYVAIGDSFTEGIGDPEPRSPGGYRGWADRVAETLAPFTTDFVYANLAIRGRLLQQIIDEQVDAALELRPDLITISGGGNDVLRPNTDPDVIADRLEATLAHLRADGATVLVFTGPDIGLTPVLNRARGKVAILNENLRAAAARQGAVVADMWAMRELRDSRMWAPDRIHFSPSGHQAIARMVLATLGMPSSSGSGVREPPPVLPWRQARADDLDWARGYLVPWVVRRVRRRSSGDGISAKRPAAESIVEPD